MAGSFAAEYTGNITITNADYTAEELATINNRTTGVITLNTAGTALSGTAANLAVAFSGTVTEHTGTVTITDAPSVAELKAINAGTTGAITLDVTNGALSGTAEDLVLAFAGTITTHTGNITITNADYTVAQLKAINAATTGAITLNTTNTALTGTAGDLVLAFAGTITTHTGNITITDTPTDAQLATIDAATTGTITITDTTTNAQLSMIDAATTDTITYGSSGGGSDNDPITGTAAQVIETLQNKSSYTGDITITNDYTVAQLKAINAATTGTITLNTTNVALSGTSSDLALAFAGTITEYIPEQ